MDSGDPYTIDWAQFAPRLVDAARDDHAWYAALAGHLLAPGDRVAVDVGCGGGGMTLALAAALAATGGPAGDRAAGGPRVLAVDGEPAVLAAARERISAAGLTPGIRVEFVPAELGPGLAPLRQALAGPADLIWAAHSLHHLGDQQAAITGLAGLLAAGGRLALAEGGLPARHLPWDLGVGEPGLEVRLDAAQNRWFAQMRAALPDSVPMPYGWTEALRRAGLAELTTRTTLLEDPAPLSEPQRRRVVEKVTHLVDRLRPSGLLAAADLATWDRLLDPDDPAWLGRRGDLYRLTARSVHIGTRPG